MKLAMLSDIHANLLALEACLLDCQKQGVDQLALLGDLVGYGAQPAQLVERVHTLQQSRGAIVLRGNHEEIAICGVDGESIGAQTAAWTHQQLRQEQLAWFEQLPLTHRWSDVLLVHATAHSPEKWHYAVDARVAGLSLAAACEDPAIRYVFGGHVHHQSLYYKSSQQHLISFSPTAGVAIPVPAHRCWLATVGSVGQPRDGDTRAGYAIFDNERRTLTFRRVAYDHLAAAMLVRQAGLPETIAARLETAK
jgi:diadenosine tetraphosphatase ApaH/serine/threonine PP2A family protein phosphatase